MTASYAALIPLAVLFAGVLLQLILAGVLTARAKGWLALFSGIGSLAGVVAIWPTILSGHTFDITFGHWDGPIQLAYHIDGLGFLFALMGAGIGSAVLLRGSFPRLPQLGTGGALLFFPCRFLVQGSRGGLRSAQSSHDDSPCRLRIIRSRGAALLPYGFNSMDRCASAGRLYHRHLSLNSCRRSR